MLPIYYTSDEPGAPTLNNANGSLISVLDAVLINGFGLKSVTSITVAGGVATVTCAGHQFAGGVGRLVQIAGASPSALNGNQVATVVDANTFTFQTTAANGTATGTITARRAPLGWQKVFGSTNKAIYGRTDPQATAMLLRIDDTGTGVASTTYARAVMCESATDVDTMTGVRPTTAQLSGGWYVSKGQSSTAAKKWLIVGDERTVYVFTDGAADPWSSDNGLASFAFGDINSYRSGGDAYGCIISGSYSTSDTCYLLTHNYGAQSAVIARANNQITPSPWVDTIGRVRGAGELLGGSGPAYPSAVDGGAAIERTVHVRETDSAGAVRGEHRGLAHPFANMSSVYQAFHGTILTDAVGSSDSYLWVAHTRQGSDGLVLFNLTSPW